jgi:choice-of-anchor C domain-containing protein
LTSGHTLGPWTVGGGGIDWIGGYWQPYEGNGSIDLSGNHPGNISTTLWGTIAGEQYTLSFYLAGNPDQAGPKSLAVVIPGVQQEIFTFSAANSALSMGWIEETFNFTASANDTVLTFMANPFVDSPYGPALDAVTVSSAIPEPASMLTAGVGLLLVSGLLRLRKRLHK